MLSKPFQISIKNQKSKESVRISPFYKDYIDYILVTEGEIESRVQKLAQEIVHFYQERPFICIIILKGSLTFFEILKRNMQ